SASSGIVSLAERTKPSGAKTNRSRAWSRGLFFSVTAAMFAHLGNPGEIDCGGSSGGGMHDHHVAGRVVGDLVGHVAEDEAFGQPRRMPHRVLSRLRSISSDDDAGVGHEGEP